MGVSTYLYAKQTGAKTKPLRLAGFINSLTKVVNSMVKDSYEAHGGKDVIEKGRFPFNLNRATLREFDYTSHGDDREFLQGTFSVFVAKDDFSSRDAHYDSMVDKHEQVVPHYNRMISVMSNAACDAKNWIEGVNENDEYISASFGCNEFAQKVLRAVGEEIKATYGAEVYFISNDCSEGEAVAL